MDQNMLRPGYVYHIKDCYFDAVQDSKLMRNHENGALRPTYFCLQDSKSQLLWMIPMSSRTEKYQPYIDRDLNKYNKCLKLVIGKYAQRDSVFLLQNMFPILPKYIDHIHIIQKNAVPVDSRLQRLINHNFKELLRLQRRGIRIVFPDIERLERLMLNELAKQIT
ncbi:MAG: hypothetical protein FWH26_02390 [Oscillospiraceae bacterium]|nr:hypothetical protein [Oscillospiraceae bacterium]